MITLDQLFEFPHVAAQFAGVTMATSELKAGAGRNRSNPTINVSTFNVIPTLVRSTRSVGILPSRMMDVAAERADLRKLEVAFDMPKFDEQLIWHSRFAYDPAFGGLRNVMLSMA